MRIVCVGDSIAAGLGVPAPFAELFRQRAQERTQRPSSLLNLAASAMQINETQTHLDRIVAYRPDLILIAHGITESLIRPVPGALRMMPKRWRRPGWMDPRPYYSRKFSKRVFQRIESSVRWRMKIALINAFGGIRFTTEDNYINSPNNISQHLLTHTTARLFLISHPGIDERYYPNSVQSLDSFWDASLRLAADGPADLMSRVAHIDIRRICHRWQDFFDDHFRPNQSGHRKISEELSKAWRTKSDGIL